MRCDGSTHVARTLGISESTVRNHLGAIYWKLGVKSRLAAVVVAIRQGIVHME
ncbi:MAG: response regulator transcription factor [Chloroflexi bacterium]|nr:response regulator transcription factor [Chloroflexota bacterium]